MVKGTISLLWELLGGQMVSRSQQRGAAVVKLLGQHSSSASDFKSKSEGPE